MKKLIAVLILLTVPKFFMFVWDTHGELTYLLFVGVAMLLVYTIAVLTIQRGVV